MDRRGFLNLLGAGVAGIALDQAIPFNRAWSFPSKIVIPEKGILGRASGFEWDSEVNVGSLTQIRVPARFEIGDIITLNDWPGVFVVSRIVNEKIEMAWTHANARPF